MQLATLNINTSDALDNTKWTMLNIVCIWLIQQTMFGINTPHANHKITKVNERQALINARRK
jgi:hypothetical protein